MAQVCVFLHLYTCVFTSTPETIASFTTEGGVHQSQWPYVDEFFSFSLTCYRTTANVADTDNSVNVNTSLKSVINKEGLSVCFAGL